MKKLVDSAFLLSAIRSRDPHHWICAGYFRDHSQSTWVIPAIAYFEYQAAQARLKKDAQEPYRDLFLPRWEVYDVSLDLIRKAAELDLVNVFERLHGPDLICACISRIEQIPLVSCNDTFNHYAAEIEVVNPLLGVA